jgi:OPA family sugar phosphate sensor protein UhpC-like MFS transporter
VALSNWWTKEERGRYFGIWSTAHAWGEGATYLIVAALVSWLGWRAGFIAPAVVCTAASVLVYKWYQDRPASRGLPAPARCG